MIVVCFGGTCFALLFMVFVRLVMPRQEWAALMASLAARGLSSAAFAVVALLTIEWLERKIFLVFLLFVMSHFFHSHPAIRHRAEHLDLGFLMERPELQAFSRHGLRFRSRTFTLQSLFTPRLAWELRCLHLRLKTNLEQIPWNEICEISFFHIRVKRQTQYLSKVRGGGICFDCL